MLPLQYSGMIDCGKYLLATRKNVEDFKSANSKIISTNRSKFIKWIKSLPLCEKVDYLKTVPDNEIPFVIGLICLLYWEGLVNISFHDEARMLSREPENMEEYQQWSMEAGFKIWEGRRRE